MNIYYSEEGKTESSPPSILPIPSIVMNDGEVEKSSSCKPKSSKKSSKNNKKNRKISSQDIANSPDIATILTESQPRERRGDIARVRDSTTSSELKLGKNSWCQSSSAEAISPNKRQSAMERADLSPYSSDAWEEDSDTDGDHSDSSDDDDPKSQVDRLIEKGTLIYLNGENSALSSEGESDDDYDSESDITDVSPIVSAAPSPLGLSPVLPRRTVPTSPLALHDNRELIFKCSPPDIDSDCDSDDHSDDEYCNSTYHHHRNSSPEDATDMDLLLKAVIELENQNGTIENNMHNYRSSRHRSHHHHSKAKTSSSSGFSPHEEDSTNGFLHPIRDNPHHHHLRKNMSFSNEEVRKIDRENKILLRKIMAAHNRSTNNSYCAPPTQIHHKSHKPTNAAVNRRKNEERIRKENLLLLKKIQEAKPSKEIERTDRPTSVGRPEHHLSSHRPIQSPSSSCGAFLRSMGRVPHTDVPNSRKETAL